MAAAPLVDVLVVELERRSLLNRVGVLPVERIELICKGIGQHIDVIEDSMVTNLRRSVQNIGIAELSASTKKLRIRVDVLLRWGQHQARVGAGVTSACAG